MISLQLSAGSLASARRTLERLLNDDAAQDDTKAIAKAIVASCYGNWPLVQETLQSVQVESPAADSIAANNLAVAFLNAGQLGQVCGRGSVLVCSRRTADASPRQASTLLQSRLDEARTGSFVEPVLFNTVSLPGLKAMLRS